jgi:hypothetical protein
MKSFSAYEPATWLTISKVGFCSQAHTLLSGASLLCALIVALGRIFLELAHIAAQRLADL